MPDPASQAAWLRSLTMESVSRALPPAAVVEALQCGFEYKGLPKIDPSGGISAGLWTPRDRSVGRCFAIRVSSRSQSSGHPHFASQCNCFNPGLCLHGIALILDLSLSEGLRHAVLSGRNARKCFSELPALRAAALAPRIADTLVSRWASRSARPPRLEYSLTVVDAHERIATEPVPHIHVRANFEGSKTAASASTISSAQLRVRDQQILAVLTPFSQVRKGWYAAGIMASVLVQLLRDEVVLHAGPASRVVRFADQPLGIRIDRRQMSALAAGSDYEDDDDDDDDDEDAEDDLDDDDFQHAAAVFAARRRPARVIVPPPRASRVMPLQVDVLEARWHSDDGSVDESAATAVFFAGPFPYVWLPSVATFFPVDSRTDQSVAAGVQSHPTMPLAGAEPAAVFRSLRTRLRGGAVKLPRAEAMGLSALATPTFTVRIEGTPLDVRVRLDVSYPGLVTHALSSMPDALSEDQARDRDLDLEDAAVSRLRDAGLGSDPAGSFAVAGIAAVAFWETGIAKLRANAEPPLELVIAAQLRNVRVRAPVRSRIRISLADGWLDTSVEFESEAAAADMAGLRSAVAGGQRWVVLDDGSLAKITDAVAELVAEISAVLPDGAKARLAAHQLGRVERWIEASDDAEVDAAVGEFRARLRALAVATDARIPRGLRAELRPYQNRGLAWLQFLHELGAGGILADDMGLGKTVMTLAMLLTCRQQQGSKPSLVVCPTSVVGNWAREAARFTPKLRVLVLHGVGRHERRAEILKSDLVVTTYALLREDIDALEAVSFRYGILDEAQNVKNSEAVTTRVARRLRCERRLALTGTPVENRLMELWSIMDFCNPGMLGTASEFEKNFERAIVADPLGPAARDLRAAIRPFVLRRSKRDVLTDLPPKEEIDVACSLDRIQRGKYDALAAVLRTELEEKIREHGVAGSGMSILTALLRLRQMACDPRLIDPTFPASLSAKREAFLERVRELVAEGRRALVFSQFVDLLTLWRADLDAEGIAYEYLDGSTRNRDALVTRFQTGTAPLFLISLRAGGTGLNLTAADTVIHCDPWWNPAVEDQASDRAHRIGQRRAVTVYRLVARGTVEDSIMKLKAAKRGLADAVISADAGALRGLSESDVSVLLGDVADDSPAFTGVAPAGRDDRVSEVVPVTSDAPMPMPMPMRIPSAAASATANANPIARANATVPVAAPRSQARKPAHEEPAMTGERLDAVAQRATRWLERTGLHRTYLAQRSGIAPTIVSKLLTGRIESLPASWAARLIEVIETEAG